MLSALWRFTLVDPRQRRAKVDDLAVALLEGDYPPVTHLFFRNANKQQVALPWNAAQSIDWQAGHIKVADLDGDQVASELPKQEVLLTHDILDALIIDLQNRRTTRANDLWLEEKNGQLLLRAADTLEVMTPERQLQVFEELGEEQGLRLLALMAPDIAADIIGRLDPRTARQYLNRLPKRQGERIIELLSYPEDTVGGIMTNDAVIVPVRMTVRDARRALRDRLKEPDFVYYVYVVEDEETRRLCGAVTLRDLLTAEEERALEEIMNPYLITLAPLDPATGAGLALIPNVPVIQLLVTIQVLNGALLPIMLVFLLLLINDQRLTGDLKNTRLYNVLGWGTFALITTAVVVMLGGQALALLGISISGGK